MELLFPYTIEKLGDHIDLCVTKEHKFGTDAFLLADFAAPRRKDIVCDLGTGCGIIPFIMYKNNYGSKITGVDIQEKAIAQFTFSIKQNKASDKLFPVLSDLNDLKGKIEFGSFDVVTCNPPYKAAEQGIESANMAEKIARHEIHCTIHDVCNTASKLLKFGGKLCICQRPERLCDVITAMKQADIEPKRLRFVQKNKDSAPWLFLIEGKKGSKPFLKVDAPLYIQGKDGFSDELLKIYGLYHSVQEEHS